MKKKLAQSAWLLFSFLYILPGCGTKKDKESLVQVPAYGKDAVLFSLSMFSNVNSGMDTTIAGLQSHLVSSVKSILANDTIRKLAGNWKLVWGPVSYTYDRSVPGSCESDNVMMVLGGINPSSPGDSMYVIAIAATNFDSPYDWADEDFQSASMVQWPATKNLPNISQFTNTATKDTSVTNAGNYISQGTATGLNILYNILKDPGSGLSLMQFLKNRFGKSSSSIEVATTGHSLAGALGPSLALSLKDNQPYWNPSGKCLITSYATAGPSPGNKNWAAYFSKQVGSNFHGAFNTLDIVPHAFQYKLMRRLPTIYDSLILPVSGTITNCFLGSIITCAAGNVQKFNYTTIFSPSTFFTNSFPLNVDSMYQSGLSIWKGFSYAKQSTLAAEISSDCDINILDNHAPYFAVAVCYGGIAEAEHSAAYINLYGARQANAIYSRYLYTAASFDVDTFLWDMVGNPLLKGCIF